ncbi:activating signal cointegrator 1 complex subunit 2 isoform X2 [Daktulosphaira vitifoliae]|nr:activating signal cointegrator 1 complex subunit 2 isoform X2 [Daktulosphaira vitifoliae]
MKYLVDDFKILLNLPHMEFWSTILFNKSSIVGFHTFIQEATPSYLLDHFSEDVDMITIYNEIEELAYCLFKRLTTPLENEKIPVNNLLKLLCENNILNIPILFDVCVLYGQEHTEELKTLINILFSNENVFSDNLKSTIQYMNKCFNQFQIKIEFDLAFDNQSNQNLSVKSSAIKDKDNLMIIDDIIDFLLDISYSINSFIEIYPISSTLFYKEKFYTNIASFYHSIKPIVYKKLIMMNKLEQFNDKLHASRLLLLKCVHQCLNNLIEGINNKKEPELAVEEYLEVIQELLTYNEFIIDYNYLYNLTEDLQKCKKMTKNKDITRYTYLENSLLLLKVSNEDYKEKLSESQVEKLTNNSFENAKLQSLISDVKDLLPHLGEGFIQLCLEYYDMNSEKVISMVLENSLPPELTKYDFSLSSLSLEENEIDSNTSVKLNKKIKKLKKVLDDKSFRNEMRPFYEQYNFTEVTSAELESYYDDEYDDTYDEVEYIIPEPLDENEKRRPNVIPRVLLEKKTLECFEEYLSDDNQQEQPILNFQPFCENPEDLRERQARKYDAKQNNRANRNKTKVPTSSISDSRTELDRQRKNENKAFHGNHNRRNAARSKQQKGMF